MTQYCVEYPHEVVAAMQAQRAVGFVPQSETARPKA